MRPGAFGRTRLYCHVAPRLAGAGQRFGPHPRSSLRTLLGSVGRALVPRRHQTGAHQLPGWRLQRHLLQVRQAISQNGQTSRRPGGYDEGLHQIPAARQQDQGWRDQHGQLRHRKHHFRYQMNLAIDDSLMSHIETRWIIHKVSSSIPILSATCRWWRNCSTWTAARRSDRKWNSFANRNLTSPFSARTTGQFRVHTLSFPLATKRRKVQKYFNHFLIFINLDHINTIFSILPCEILARFDKTIKDRPIVHIAITSTLLLVITDGVGRKE